MIHHEIILAAARWSENMLSECLNSNGGALSREQRSELRDALKALANLSDLLRADLRK